jgi:hypothetical protein
MQLAKKIRYLNKQKIKKFPSFILLIQMYYLTNFYFKSHKIILILHSTYFKLRN